VKMRLTFGFYTNRKLLHQLSIYKILKEKPVSLITKANFWQGFYVHIKKDNEISRHETL
jgi:hypothetical protein